MEIIATHTNADFDALAAAVAAKKIYPNAKIVLPGAQNRNVREFLALHEDAIEVFEPWHVDMQTVSRLILVDNKIGRRLGELKEIAYKQGIEIFTFDHHPSTPEDVPITRDFSENVGASTTILIKIIRDKGLKITPLEATLFALGIHEDTGSLTFKTTTYSDAEAFAYLMANGANLDMIHKFLNPALAENQHELLDRLIHSAYVIDVQSIPIMITKAAVSEYIEGASVVVHKLADIENVDVVFTLLEQKDRISVIARSRSDTIDVGIILEQLGGGGHAQAASANVKNASIDEVESKLHKLLKKFAKQPIRAHQIMSAPVRVVDASLSIKDANKLLIRYGFSGLPVVEGNKLVGLIGRKEIDKAAHHGLSHAPVKGFMMRHVKPISPDTTLPEIQKILVEENLGRVPVVKDNKVIGIISKTDVLKALAGEHYFESVKTIAAAKPSYTPGEIAQKIKSLLPGNLQELLRLIGDTADNAGFKAYLVGGIVRDILLNVRNLDIDIVIEGDAIEFAHLVAAKVRARVRAHQKFGTAVLIMPDGFKIDFASARAEYYEKPAALPQVEPTSIKQDLARRDFSINAMAVSLNTKNFGKLLDFFNGQRDLKNGIIRVLHNLSFIEDPTRIFRGVRFEQRLGFKMDSETEDLLKKAIEMDLIGQLSDTRIRDELLLILAESQPFKILKRLSELGALKVLEPSIQIDTDLKKLFKKIDDSIVELEHLFSNPIHKRLLYAAALLRNIEEPRLLSWCERFKLKKIDTTRLHELIIKVPQVILELETQKRIKNSKLYDILHALSADAIVYAYAFSDDFKVKQRIKFYLTNLKGVKLHVDGRYLRKIGFPPSPMYNVILRELLAAKLNGKLKSAEDEIKFIDEKVSQIKAE